jgi:hypothetical protein
MNDRTSQLESDIRDPRAVTFIPSHRASIVQLRHKSIISRTQPAMSTSQNTSRNGSQTCSSQELDGHWRNLWCVEPSDDVGSCCLAFWVPWVSYGQTAWKVKRGNALKCAWSFGPQETAASSRHSSIQQQSSNQTSISQDEPESKSSAECGCNNHCLIFWISGLLGHYNILTGEALWTSFLA